MTKREIAIVLWAFCAVLVAQDKTTTLTATTSLPTSTVRAADPDEKIAVGGRVITIREYMAEREQLQMLLNTKYHCTCTLIPPTAAPRKDGK